MRGKKWLTIITFLFAVIALIIAVVIGKGCACIAYDVAMAIFGSALLGFIMSLTEYFVERRSAMEWFWQESRNVLSKLRKVKYINIDAPLDLVHACFQEEWSNDLRKIIDPTAKDVAKNVLISWYEENIPMSWTEDDDIDAELDKMYNSQMQGYREEYMQCIDSCIEASTIDLGSLGNAYGNLDFIFRNKGIRDTAYSEIYEKIRDFRNLLLSESYHFIPLKSGKGNFPVCAGKADDICRKVFDVQYKTEGGFKTKLVYQKAFDDIDKALEDFRLKIYRNATPDYPERVPVLGNTHIVDFEHKSSDEGK
ncbi:MAG: hypothetical protein GX218_05495 [Clostridiaceae bacterium]|jgi:hypothetical protein|nr:hypothetical protein [Clostridiaceae bacterium]